MKSKLILLVLLCSVALFAQQGQTTLNSAYQVKTGDFAAILLKGFLGGSSKFYTPSICTYEPDANTIDVEIYGEKGDVEGARQSINEYWNFIKTSYIPYAQRRLGVAMTEKNFRIMYYDRASAATKLVLQFIDGQFYVPSK